MLPTCTRDFLHTFSDTENTSKHWLRRVTDPLPILSSKIAGTSPLAPGTPSSVNLSQGLIETSLFNLMQILLGHGCLLQTLICKASPGHSSALTSIPFRKHSLVLEMVSLEVPAHETGHALQAPKFCHSKNKCVSITLIDELFSYQAFAR